MREARIIFKNIETVYYVSNDLMLDLPDLLNHEQGELEKIILDTAAFFGMETLSYVVFKRGYAMLIRVPATVEVSNAEIIKMVSKYYGKSRGEKLRLLSKNPSSEEYMEIIQRHKDNLCNLQHFVRLYSQRFSLLYNRNKKKKGSIWRQRFRSYPVEDNHEIITQAVAYVHTRPINMGIVKDPSKCKFSSWAKAVSGDLKWEKKYRKLTKQKTWKSAKTIYSKKHEIMAGRMNKPFFGRIDQELIKQYREKNKITPAILRARKHNWKKMFNQLKIYGEKNGNYLFPRNSKKYSPLLKWIRNQRNHLRKGSLVKEYLDAFKSIDFPLDVKTYIIKSSHNPDAKPSKIWMNNFKIAKNYSLKNKGLQPPYKNKAVARWITVQRHQHKKNRLTKISVDLLNSINFPW